MNFGIPTSTYHKTNSLSCNRSWVRGIVIYHVILIFFLPGAQIEVSGKRNKKHAGPQKHIADILMVLSLNFAPPKKIFQYDIVSYLYTYNLTTRKKNLKFWLMILIYFWKIQEGNDMNNILNKCGSFYISQ